MKQKESFSQLYSRLYTENFTELEAMRKKEKNKSVMIFVIIFAIMMSLCIHPIFMLLIIVVLVNYVTNKKRVKEQTGNENYTSKFKEKIVTPLIENVFSGAKYIPTQGISPLEYRKAGYRESYDRFYSHDYIMAPLRIKDEVVGNASFAEVHTERESRDSDGDTTWVTVFSGLAGSFSIPKDITKNIYIRANGRVSNWNKNKVKMDMGEFEKIFDVESEDPILVMRILTADIMAEIVDLYKKYKYRFEINILKDTVYMRLSTGPMFEPNIFKSSMEYKQIEKYYLVIKALSNIAEHVYETIEEIEI